MSANSVDPSQMPYSAVSDLGLHCLPTAQKRDTRLIVVKTTTCIKAHVKNISAAFYYKLLLLHKTVVLLNVPTASFILDCTLFCWAS